MSLPPKSSASDNMTTGARFAAPAITALREKLTVPFGGMRNGGTKLKTLVLFTGLTVTVAVSVPPAALAVRVSELNSEGFDTVTDTLERLSTVLSELVRVKLPPFTV